MIQMDPLVPMQQELRLLHEAGPGRGGHYFKKVAGVWTCKCGETRNQHGQKAS